MKLLIVMDVPFPGPSAGANHMRRLAAGLVRSGHDVLVVAPRRPGDGLPPLGIDAGGIAYSSFHMPTKPPALPYYPYWVTALRPRLHAHLRVLLERNPWHAALLQVSSWWTAEPLRKLCQIAGTLFIPYPVEWMAPTIARVANLSWPDQWLQRNRTFPQSDALIGISRAWATLASELRLPSLVVPALSKYDDRSLPEVDLQKGTRFQISFVGRFSPRELPSTLVRGLELAIAMGVDLEFLSIGSTGTGRDEGPGITQLRRSPSLLNRSRILGWVPESVLERTLAESDAFVLLRRDNHENRALFPTRLPEYLATGKPLIVSEVGDLGLHLEHRRSAWLLPPGDEPEALAKAILHLSRHPDEASRIGAGGRQTLSTFSQTAQARRVVDFVSALAQRRSLPNS